MDRFSISSGLMTASLGQHISELRTQIGKTSTEATTGRYEDLTLHLSGRIGKAMLGQKALADISTDREVLNLRANPGSLPAMCQLPRLRPRLHLQPNRTLRLKP